jgi:ribosomal protein S18 acetylase RimI-like enzyme
MIKKLSWDSEFFDKSICQIVVEEATRLEDLKKEIKEALVLYDIVYLFVSNESKLSTKIKEEYKSFYIDSKVEYIKNIERVQDEVEVMEYLSKENSKEITNLAFQSGQYSRFLLDPKFSPTDFKRLYEKWVTGSLERRLADWVLVFNNESKILGFVTAKIVNAQGNIGLIGVDEVARGMKIGTKLMNKVSFLLQQKGISSLIVPTQQSNRNACMFYEKMGFQIKSQTSIYHIHK